MRDTHKHKQIDNVADSKKRGNAVFILFPVPVMPKTNYFCASACKMFRNQGLNFWISNQTIDGGWRYAHYRILIVSQIKVFLFRWRLWLTRPWSLSFIQALGLTGKRITGRLRNATHITALRGFLSAICRLSC